MNRSFRDEPQKLSLVIAALIGVITAMVLILNGVGLMNGITNVLPHLFYIPIILTAYYFPRRGIQFSIIVSALYFGTTYFILPNIAEVLFSAGGRILIFILIAAVVSFLTIRMGESEALFRGVAERSSDIILLTDMEGRATYASPSAKKILGYDPAEIVGKSPGDFIHPDDLGTMPGAMTTIQEGKNVDGFTLRFMKKDGNYTFMEFFGSPIIKDGATSGMQVIGRDITEKKWAEEEKKARDDLLNAILESMIAGVVVIDPETHTIIDVNAVAAKMIGAKKEELIGTVCTNHICPALKGACPITDLFHTFDSSEKILLRANGEKCPILKSVVPITLHGKKYLLESFIDISELNRAKEALSESEEKYRETTRRLAEIIRFLPDPTMVINKAGVVVAWNHSMELLSGIPGSEILNKGEYSHTSWISGPTGPVLIDYIVQQDIEGIKRNYPNAIFEGNMVKTETNITRLDGTLFTLWISATPLINRKGEVTGAIETLRDITHLKKIQRALKESNEYLDTVINTLADPLFIKDRNHRFVKLNNSFCQFSGRTREETLGKNDYDFFSKEEADIFREKDEQVFLTGQGNENEENVTDALGKTHTVITKKTLYTNPTGEEFIVGIIRDITERKKTEHALQQALKKLNMLSSITRHDILNQIMGLRLFLELTRDRETDPEIIDFLMKGDQAADTIRRQIEFTRYYQDLGVHAPVWHDVAEIFLSAVSQLPLGEIRVEVQVTGLEVYADPLIEKVFYNLMENTLRHAGQVTSVGLSAELNPDGAVITYTDNGSGISVEDKKNLFRRGFGKHTGLGLFLSREILSITGISITETGTTGTGVRFEIHVPKDACRCKEAP